MSGDLLTFVSALVAKRTVDATRRGALPQVSRPSREKWILCRCGQLARCVCDGALIPVYFKTLAELPVGCGGVGLARDGGAASLALLMPVLGSLADPGGQQEEVLHRNCSIGRHRSAALASQWLRWLSSG